MGGGGGMKKRIKEKYAHVVQVSIIYEWKTQWTCRKLIFPKMR